MDSSFKFSMFLEFKKINEVLIMLGMSLVFSNSIDLE